jgi:hypothetical protein
MRFVLSFVLLWLASPILAAGDEFCAAKVFVVDGARQPVQTTVRLTDPSGKVVESRETSNGSVEFCDFGFGAHKIQIGDGCVVTITDVRVLNFRRPNNYSAIYNCPRRPGDDTSIYGGPPMDAAPVMTMLSDEGKYVLACPVYLRISSEDDSKIAGAEVAAGTPYPNPIIADRYGRVFFSIPFRSTRRIAISAAGFSAESIDVGCEERAVALRKNP